MDLVLLQPYLDGRGGSERVVLELARNFSPIIYTFKYEKASTYPEFSDCDIRMLKPSGFGSLASSAASIDSDMRMSQVAAAGFTFLGVKLKDDYDVINAHLPPSEWIRNRNERVCWYCHGPNVAFDLKLGIYNTMLHERSLFGNLLFRSGAAVYRAIELPIMKKMEKICTCSDLTKEKIARSLGRDDAEVVYPGVEPKEFECTGYEKFFLISSRFVPEKRMEFAIEAFKKFNKARKWKLVIIGHLFENARNLAYFEKLKELAQGANVSFEVNASDTKLKLLYASCYAALFSSIDEDWGIVILEAMASSKPVISVNKGGPTISIKDGETGFLVNSIDEMAEKMRYLSDHPDICEQMGKAGRKRVEQNYTWKIFLDGMEKAFKETAKK